MQQSLLQTIVRFAQTCEAVSALVLVGSQARNTRPADAYSDTDLILIVRDPDRFTQSDTWLREIGNAHISFTEPTIDGQHERRVLFDDAQDVDFVIMEEGAAKHALETGEASNILSRGYRVLVAKHGFAVPPTDIQPVPAFASATETEFTNTVNDFWYHSIWSAKKLLRQELWTAKFCVDGYMKQKLLWMIEQHEHTVHRSGADTWYKGRFIEQWAQYGVLCGLQNAFAHYDSADITAALLETMKLFRRLATEVAEALGLPYPTHADAYATAWVQAQLAHGMPKAGDAP